MKKLWHWIWYSRSWYWRNTVTGEVKDSNSFFKITCLLSIVVCFGLLVTILFGK